MALPSSKMAHSQGWLVVSWDGRWSVERSIRAIGWGLFLNHLSFSVGLPLLFQHVGSKSECSNGQEVEAAISQRSGNWHRPTFTIVLLLNSQNPRKRNVDSTSLWERCGEKKTLWPP